MSKFMTVMTLVVVVAGVVTGCSRKPKTQKDQVSYSIGVNFGRSMRQQNLDLDTKNLARGVVEGYTGEKLRLSDEEMQTAMVRLSEDRQKAIQAEAEKNKLAAEEFLEKNKKEMGVKTTPSGLQYKIVKEGSGPSPKRDDIVVVNYRGTLLNGMEFDSSYKRNMPAEFPVKGVIPGWTEGLMLMKKGSKAEFYIPPELGYGDRPRGNIPGNSVLTFEVELVDVKPGGPARK